MPRDTKIDGQTVRKADRPDGLLTADRYVQFAASDQIAVDHLGDERVGEPKPDPHGAAHGDFREERSRFLRRRMNPHLHINPDDVRLLPVQCIPERPAWFDRR